MIIRSVEPSDREWVLSMVREWGGTDFIISRGRRIYPADLPGLCAISDDGYPLGLATYEIIGGDCQMVTLLAKEPLRGVGTALVRAVRAAAVEAGSRRLWLITTNDNLDALRFYQRRGFEISAIHRDLRQAARRLKPSMPEIGNYGIAIRDEIELEMMLCRADSPGAVIFDMDGVILDSNEAWDTVTGELFAEYGRSLGDVDESVILGGDNSMQWARYMHQVLGIPLTEEEIISRVTRGIIARFSGRVPLIAGAAEALARISARFPLGLASSSPREVIAFVLQQSGLDRLFQAWVSSDDVACGKPSPDVYLRCSELLAVSPEVCVAVEDSRVGVQSAKAAGMKVIAMPTRVFRLDAETLASADAVVESIDELGPELVDRLLRPCIL
ncbi:MAG: HAD-IA family hydrolase [Actinobacteria bacterium]|nr:HAD-IA family hydrolase [Actinomycetota bacterium]